MDYHIAKGVFDILPEDPDPSGQWRESHLWQHVEKIVRSIANQYGFKEIRTPIFEHTSLFQRLGEGTDIVTKEMYTFLDKGNRSLTLRPEGTAPVMRAFIEKHLDQQHAVHKFFYLASMFRYERQQAGRFRQHHQFGIEAIGIGSPFQDAEVIDLLYTFLLRLGLKGMTLHLNSIGDKEARIRYREELQKALTPHLSQLSTESQERFYTNPLRILDSKDPRDRELTNSIPSIIEFLNEEDRQHFEQLCGILKEFEIPYKINPKLVRGLDYYNRTVFEITAEELGAQNSLGGGGRYDGLMKEMGGPDLPSCGFGSGIERLIQTMLAQNVPLPSRPHPLLYVIPLGEVAKQEGFKLIRQLRQKGLDVEIDLSDRKLKAALRQANACAATYVVVLGEEELKNRLIELKEMQTGKNEKISLDALEKRLKNHGEL